MKKTQSYKVIVGGKISVPKGYPGNDVARKAFDVMMRQFYHICHVNGDYWYVSFRTVIDGEFGTSVEANDPFTALVEAEKKYLKYREDNKL